MSVNTLLADLAVDHWLLNNCYQVDATLWRVNLRRPDDNGAWFTDWAEAPTFAEALEDCMSKLASAEFTTDPIQYTIATPKQPSIAEALAAHMRKAAPPIKRRV